MVRCAINLENNSRAVYTAGQLLKGTIELHLDHPKKIRAFWFVVYGAAKCHWTESQTTSTGSGKNRRTHRRTIHYEGKDVYLNQKTFLFGSNEAAPVEMASGTHKYDFSCHLPALLPASFRATHGHVSYEVEAVMDIPWGFDKEFKLEFTVVRHVDLNEQPDLRIPVKSEEIKRFCCLFCESEPLIMTVTLPCSGFVPGQNIPVTIDFVNKSNVDVFSTDIFLKRIIRYTSRSPHQKMKYESEKMVAINAPGVRKSLSNKMEKSVVIPSILMPTNVQYCNVVQIYYELKISAHTDGCSGNAELTIPITIGSVSFSSSNPYTASSMVDSPMPSAPTGFTANYNTPKPLESPQDLPPPSYNEAVNPYVPNDTEVTVSDVKINFSPPSGSTLGWIVEGTESPSAPEK